MNSVLLVLFWLIQAALGSGDLDFRSAKLADGNTVLIINNAYTVEVIEGYLTIDGHPVVEPSCGLPLRGINAVQLDNAVDSIWCYINGCGGMSWTIPDCDAIAKNLGIKEQGFTLYGMLLMFLYWVVQRLYPLAKKFDWYQIRYSCLCSFHGKYDVGYNAGRVREEIKEFLKCPSYSEFSDVMLNLSCLLQAIDPEWDYVLPGGVGSMLKGLFRYKEHGCCRSWRNRDPQCVQIFESYRLQESLPVLVARFPVDNAGGLDVLPAPSPHSKRVAALLNEKYAWHVTNKWVVSRGPDTWYGQRPVDE